MGPQVPPQNSPIVFGRTQGPIDGGFLTPNTPSVFGGTRGPLAGFWSPKI
ncbi:Hypothetical protein FKW44_010752 [Caligus rogercresseyi]|uniref:Uncharacterized protein n=1 Tax=Caligus rogercresseyi TaxID=217165 RepID=A0A7T8HHG3_CALRO|nr:Hypothetical protein FKW44_010752 [Caligus rogercresseyi]